MSTELTELTPRKRAKRNQIQAGARRVFLRRGFVEASTDAIAAKAGGSKQTLYVYYPTKEELLADVLRQLMGDVLQDWPSAGAGVTKDPIKERDKLREEFADLARRVISDIMRPEYLALVRVIVAETPRLPQLGSLFGETIAERALEGVGSLLKQARGEVVTDDTDVDVTSRMFVGFLLTNAILGGLLVADGPPRKPEPAHIEAMLDLYVKAIT